MLKLIMFTFGLIVLSGLFKVYITINNIDQEIQEELKIVW
jgi:hypothetical protein